jgi:hypothetical protein
MTPNQALARPFLWLTVPLASPESEQLAYLHMRKTEFDQWAKRSELLAGQQLSTLRKDAYRVTLRLPEVTDSYFTDGPFVWSMLSPQRNITERNVLVVVNRYLQAFFDHYLRGDPNQFLDGSALPYQNVELKRYGSPAF